MRAVLDVNVIVSAALSKAAAPAELIRRWRRGDFELIVSPALLAELERALAYPKIARLIPARDAAELVGLLSDEADVVDDPPGPPPIHSDDPGDDYLLALGAEQGAALVSGDKHLLGLAGGDVPIYNPAGFLDLLASEQDSGL